MARAALASLGTSIFSEMTALAVQHGAINLAQGFPDFDGPSAIVDAAHHAMREGHNQYARSAGLPSLVRAIAAHQQRHYGITLDPMTQIVCTTGATEAMAAAALGLLEVGDEVILLSPHYDAYPAVLQMSGAVPRVVQMHFPEFRLPVDDIARAITPRTKAIVLTNPHNPTGRVFGVDELQALAALCVKHNLWAFSDEVYEHLTYDGHKHVPLCTLPGMHDRTLTISSTGKTFSFTGWKVGWAAGPRHLVEGVQAAHQFLTFCAATPLHAAMATAMDAANTDDMHALRTDYQQRRDLMVRTLQQVGMHVSVPQGAYFAVADLAKLRPNDDDKQFARWLTQQGVSCIPLQAFYPAGDRPARLVRFAFCKRMDTLQEGAKRLRHILQVA
jgi:N-succinyldiaminopimelate aminotransferase